MGFLNYAELGVFVVILKGQIVIENVDEHLLYDGSLNWNYGYSVLQTRCMMVGIHGYVVVPNNDTTHHH